MALNVSKEEFVLDFMKRNELKFFEKAYKFAEKCHDGHTRNDGTPYMGHPNEVCYIMILLGMTQEKWLSVGICHDTVEELFFKGNLLLSKEKIAEELDLEIANHMYTLSRIDKTIPAEIYFGEIEKTVELVLIKTIDRFINMRRSMFGVFVKSRMERYVSETEKFILPMSERIINSGKYPEHENPLRMMRSAIKGILEGAKHYVALAEDGGIIVPALVA